MRPTRYKREFAVAQTVADMKRQFVYPDEDTQPANPVVGGGGGAPTVVVAATNASAMSKGKADFVCTGVNDEQTIQAAIGQLTAQAGGGAGGRVLLTEGIFTLGDNSVSVGSNQFVTIQGMGILATRINTTHTTGTMFTVGIACEVRDLLLAGTGAGGPAGIGGIGNSVAIRNVGFQQLSRAVSVGADHWIIEGCREFGALPRFIDAANGTDGALIKGNHLPVGGSLLMNQAIGWTIEGNVLRGSIVFDATGGGVGERVAVLSNRWVHASTWNDAIIEGLAGPSRVAVIGNYMDCNNLWGVQIANGENGIIASNYFSHPFQAVELAGCSAYVVEANVAVLASEHAYNLGLTDGTVVGNMAVAPGQGTNDAFDGVLVDGDLNLVTGNKVAPSGGANATRSGINIVAGNDNAVYANYLGDASAYGTADFVNNGTATMTAPGANGQFSF